MLPRHGALVLVAVEVAEEHLCLVNHLEVVAVVLEDLCLVERRLELLQYSVCTP